MSCCCNPVVANAGGNFPFAYYFQDVETDAVINVGTVGTTVQTLVTPAIAAGTYIVSWYCEFDPLTAGPSCIVQADVDGTVAGQIRIGNDVDVLDVFDGGGWRVVALAAGVHTIRIVCQTTSATTDVRRRRILIQRVG